MGPLSRAVAEYLEGDFSRFHTPGHKGKDRFAPHFGWGEVWCWDVTECAGLDSLFEASGPIRETEQLYSRLYGTADSLISAGGSTLCIQAMLALALQPGDSLLAVRGVHSSAVHAMALLDLHPQWVLPSIDQATGLAGAVCPEEVERAFTCNPRLKAVYLTSPNYFGAISDIATLSKVCHSFGVPLLVDNAHGAHLAFLPQSLHPIGLGADLCCDSLHKTLPVLTGGAMLHVGNKAYASQARRKMALFGSTSPSYPVMLSIDAALSYLEREVARDSVRVSQEVERAAAIAEEQGCFMPRFPLKDPWRLTLSAAPLGLDGPGLAAHLRGHQIEPELVSDPFCVLMASPGNTEEDFRRLAEGLRALPRGSSHFSQTAGFTLPRQKVSLREAVFAPSQPVPLEQAVGRVAGAMVSPCPPGIALVVPGEEIDSQTATLLKSYGIFSIHVLH
ncbi:MAG: aminotransferase class I/II-fold pyridoxal phosphate-dependent enzyme [Oscillospiraceae bacterium]